MLLIYFLSRRFTVSYVDFSALSGMTLNKQVCFFCKTNRNLGMMLMLMLYPTQSNLLSFKHMLIDHFPSSWIS